MDPEVPKGIWYENGRSRWRVKILCNGQLVHRSYHREYPDALAAWKVAKTKQRALLRTQAPPIELSPINIFLLRMPAPPRN